MFPEYMEIKEWEKQIEKLQYVDDITLSPSKKNIE